MKQFLLIIVFNFSVLSFGQSIFSNSINGVNPSLFDPYTVGQIIDPNITVSGIGRGPDVFGVNAKNRYNAKSWKSSSLDPDAYFEFIISPHAGKKIDFVSFVFKGQVSKNGPTLFAFRSSMDNFASNIGAVTASGGTISLSAKAFQNVASPVTFRIYGWEAVAGTGSFSVNDFKFNGIVSCSKLQAPVLSETNLNCSATSFDLHCLASLFANNNFIDVATDVNFVNYVPGYKDKQIGNTPFVNISGLVIGGTYYVRMRSSNNCGISDNSNVIEVAPAVTVYNNGWSNGYPDINKNVRFSSNFNVPVLLEACSCKIDDGVAVRVETGAIVKLKKGLNVEGSGMITFENNASLFQEDDDAINTGSINYKRTTSKVKDFDYVYWSSPVENQKLKALSPLSDKFYSFKNNKWFNEAGNNMMNQAGNGFIIMVPKNLPLQEQTVEFIGVPYNGKKTIASQGANQNSLIGNPYPSAIDADSFIVQNGSLISGALYFWTHNTPRAHVGSSYIYYASDYATYTLTGMTIGSGDWAGAPRPSFANLKSGTIAAGQSFFVGTGATAGYFEFNNDMRISDPNSNNQFFKLANTKKTATIKKNRIWLNLTNEGGAFKQLLVGYITGATNDFDNLYDGITLNGNTYIDFYSINNSKNYSVQGRGLPFDSADEVPLGYKTTIAGTFQINIDNIDGVLINQSVYLEDKTMNIIHDLKSGAYSFTTEKGTFNDRFVLRYTNTSKMGAGDVETKGKDIVVSVKNHQIKINSFDQILSSVKVYDLKGSLLYEKNKVEMKEFIVDHLGMSDRFLIVMIQLKNGKWVSEEIVFRE